MSHHSSDPGEEEPSDDEYDDEIARLYVDEAIGCLAPQVARVARLHYLADLKVTDVARRMNISENTVKGYLRAAREHLRDRLGAWPGEERWP